MECSFCESKQVVLSAGYKYCRDCLWKNDEPIIHSWLTRYFSIPLSEIRAYCREMFKSSHYKLSDFPKLYGFADRGKWLEKEKRFKIRQETYLVQAFLGFMRVNHAQKYSTLKLDNPLEV